MTAHCCISPFLLILRMGFLTLPLLIEHTEARIVEWDNLGNIELGDNLPSRFSPFPFLGSIHGGQVDTLAKTRRRRQGIYDECCRKPCTYDELYSYCQ